MHQFFFFLHFHVITNNFSKKSHKQSLKPECIHLELKKKITESRLKERISINDTMTQINI